MNLIVLSLSIFAAVCLGADQRKRLSPKTNVKSKFPADSLLDLSFKRSAYMVGCELAKVKGLLVTKTKEKRTAMYVSVNRLRGIMVAKWNENIPISFVFPKMFDMESLQERLPVDARKISFAEFRWILSKCLLIPEATIVADVAILKWIVQTIDTKLDGQVVDIRPYDLKIICTLSLMPDLGKDYTTDVLKALDEIPKLMTVLNPITVKLIFYSMTALLRHLQSLILIAKLEQVFDRIFPLLVEHPMYQEFGFYLVLTFEKSHYLRARLAEKVSKKQLAVWKARSRGFTAKHKFESFFLGSWVRPSKANVRGLPIFPENETFSKLNIKASQDASASRLCFPNIVWEGFESCTSVEEFKKCLTKPETVRLLLIYEISIFSSRAVKSSVNEYG